MAQETNWVELAKELGLEGVALANFIRDERQANREESRRKQEAEDKQKELYREEKRRKQEAEDRQKELEADKLMREEEHQRKLELLDRERELKSLAVEEMKLQNLQAAQAAQLAQTTQVGKMGATPKFPYFEENKDDIDVYLKRFERHARLHAWPENQWAQHLCTLLRSSKAAEVCTWVPDTDENKKCRSDTYAPLGNVV